LKPAAWAASIDRKLAKTTSSASGIPGMKHGIASFNPMMRRVAMIMALAVAYPSVARGDDKAQAELLFSEARQLVSSGKYAEAAIKLEASNRLDPAVGTLLNLADCYEHLGRTATAWATFMQVAAMPTSGARASFAQQRAAALLPTLSKLTIQAPGAPASLRVTLDGAAIASAAYGVPVPVDPGRHVIEATSQGRSPFHREVNVPPNAASVTVIIP
jgi:tetratricopeptide (TPR) repeat protein